MDTQVEVVRLYRYKGQSRTRAFVDVAVGEFVACGLRIVQGKKGLFLAMPQEKAKDGKWFNTFYPRTKEARANLSQIVLSAYEDKDS
ncbi:MAG: SpoVG family protein [Candidatus Omnitrophica bacterium]|nr:SpoVG family protein [Candidatus Omnitrophota bacterium]